MGCKDRIFQRLLDNEKQRSAVGSLFVPQRGNRVHVGGLLGRIPSEEDAREGANHEKCENNFSFVSLPLQNH